ncbi:MAG: hypothetical protein JXQ72_01740, partial [Anaerolineae bacterium]|nr:hypothetical protein [Anaerolineae bacterium]
MIKRRTLLVIVVMFFVILAVSACGGESVAKRPVIKLQVGSQTYEEDVAFYCWPEASDDLACGPTDFAQAAVPANFAAVGPGDEIRFVIEGADVDAPSRFTATLLESGQQTNLGTTNEAVYDMALPDAQYSVRVDAEYDDVEGHKANVSYVFGLEYGGVVVMAPTDTPTPPPTDTPVPTVTNTPQPTATFTITPTPLGPPLAEALEPDTYVHAGPDSN